MTHAYRFAVMALVLAALGCGRDRSITGLVPPDTTKTPPPPPTWPLVGDLRFQQVNAPSTVNGYGAFERSDVAAGIGQSFGNMTGTPLYVGDECGPPTGSPFDCAWFFSTFFLPASDSGLAVHYQSANTFQTLSSDLATATGPNAVITSIDLRPASNTYAISWMQTTQTTGFDLRQLTLAPNELPDSAASEGAQSRVITALSFNAGQLEVFSYGWKGDTTTRYDTNVQTATLGTVGTAATNLAAAGFIITAIGGNGTNGLVLVGTRVHGDSVAGPRPLRVVPEGSQKSQLWDQGYAIVGVVYDSTNGGTTTWIGEK